MFLTFGIIAHYCAGARWPTGELFKQNITLWWACPWTLSVAAVQAGGLGMVAMGLTLMLAARVSPKHPAAEGSAALWFCIVGLLGVFAVGYPRLLRLRCDLAELLLLASNNRKERMAARAGAFHSSIFRGRDPGVQHGAACAQCDSGGSRNLIEQESIQ
ncbi:hypothetical protein [Bradyrhizobium sp. JYMT SZCCT0180]|uniref:hypothetical protein n=1 Tax=Bradyrhizobium sp. JYMT SZCCT0180 TaxID=2807666 RepID=UPI001BA836C7|nr:hypothetical protein [Bradyrhizobium sp. JYMT SZCCT0180]MBR1211825.1 hypothetical protein [Bradyrhizobium sp. JYMT SZCCT0180]